MKVIMKVKVGTTKHLVVIRENQPGVHCETA